ncbi:hypothetical protein EJ07DRAFT_157405 [Lizonia empirigonia]|nr:hypothetical protein EJ07DRAFT_157405 [Lizonia empirigonia]
MTGNDSQAELDSTGDDRLQDDQELADATHSEGEDALTDDQDSDSKLYFKCQHCSSLYTSQKSLNRHLGGKRTTCAKKHAAQAEHSASQSEPSKSQPEPSKNRSKPRWACSRCGKDCATTQSVERHIERSCWRNCDECIAEGVTRCDSVSKSGPCRLCEAKNISCTKHTSAISGCVSIPWKDPAVHPQPSSPADEEADSATQQKPTKRKTPKSPEINPKEVHKKKQKNLVDQTASDYGLGRKHDPLGGQAYVSPVVKQKGVSNWLQRQLSDGQAEMQNTSPLLSQASYTQMRQNIRQPDQLFGPTDAMGRALPLPAKVLPSQYAHRTPSYQQGFQPRSSLLQLWQREHQSAFSSHLSGLPSLSSYGDALPSASGGPSQLDHMLRQMEATRQQHAAHRLEMERRSGRRNDVTHPPPFGQSGSLDFNLGYRTAQNQAPLDRTQTPVDPSQTDSVLTLRIHSNTHDVNGQPIFSILRIRRDRTFGPCLDAYCARRGKDPIPSNLEQQKQLMLTYDMTPNDVADPKFPGMTMQNLDTIYVMQVKPSPPQTPGAHTSSSLVHSQIAFEKVDILPGETHVFQHPHVSQEWYEAVEQDSKSLRASHSKWKSLVIKAQQEVFTKEKQIAEMQKALRELTYLSGQLRKRLQRTTASASAPEPNAFVAKCEAVRDPEVQTAQHHEPLQFTNFEATSSASQSATPGQLPRRGPVYDAADKVDALAERGDEEMDES